jgi:hypothetical protein
LRGTRVDVGIDPYIKDIKSQTHIKSRTDFKSQMNWSDTFAGSFILAVAFAAPGFSGG